MRKEKTRPHKEMSAGPAKVAEAYKKKEKEKSASQKHQHTSQIQFGACFFCLPDKPKSAVECVMERENNHFLQKPNA